MVRLAPMAVLVLAFAPTVTGSEDRPTITYEIYNHSGVSHETLAAAASIVHALFAASGVDAVWLTPQARFPNPQPADEVLADLVFDTIPEKGRPEEADLNDLKEAVHGSFNIQVDTGELADTVNGREGAIEHIRTKVHEFYETKESEITPETMRQIERYIMLQTLDFLEDLGMTAGQCVRGPRRRLSRQLKGVQRECHQAFRSLLLHRLLCRERHTNIVDRRPSNHDYTSMNFQ